MDKLFKEMSQCIRVYLSISTIIDPFEMNTTETISNPIPLRAIITDLTSTQMSWKSAGIIKSGGKEIVCKKSKKALLEMSEKIEIDGVDYEGWKTNSKMEYRVEGDYIRLYIYRKQV